MFKNSKKHCGLWALWARERKTLTSGLVLTYFHTRILFSSSYFQALIKHNPSLHISSNFSSFLLPFCYKTSSQRIQKGNSESQKKQQKSQFSLASWR
ncbi:MAG: hypothetical protein MRECE_61c001 [Mycoplasmataceae bacterium CE_OT135]|nr:MAG: hypothetical protein MRECE_61c001 [Mycoplasmataceae bacterium CE_OT135]